MQREIKKQTTKIGYYVAMTKSRITLQHCTMEASLPPASGTDTETSAASGWMQLPAALDCCLWKPDVAVVLPLLSPVWILSGAMNMTVKA